MNLKLKAMSEVKNKAIHNLLSEDSPKNFIETIDLMFEAWFCSEYCDGTTIDQRSLVLTHTKALKRFLNGIEAK